MNAGPLNNAEPEIFACNSKYYGNTYQNLIETFVTNRPNLSEDQLNYVVSRLFPIYRHKIVDLLKEYNYRTRHQKYTESRKQFVLLFKELHKRAQFDNTIMTSLLKDACNSKRIYDNPNMANEEDNSISLLFNCGAKFSKDIVKNIVSRWRKHNFNKREHKNSNYNEKLHLYFLSKMTKEIYNDLIKNSYNLSFIHNLLLNTNHLFFSMEDFDKFFMAFHIQVVKDSSDADVRAMFCESLTAIEKKIGVEKSESLLFQYFEQYLRKHDFDKGIYYTFFKNIQGKTTSSEGEAVRMSIHIIHNELSWRCVVYTGVFNKRLAQYGVQHSVKFKIPKETPEVFLSSIISVVQEAVNAQESGEIDVWSVNEFIKKTLVKELKTQYIVTHL